jgi:glycosyltransferase involved in cell wall biosynthesis
MPRKLLTIGHSYVTSVNRSLAHEFQRQSEGKWEVTVAAPRHFHGRNDIRPLDLDPLPNELIHLEGIDARWTKHIHFFHYKRRLKQLLHSGFDLVHAWEEPYISVGLQIALNTPKQTPLVFRTAQSLDKRYPFPFRWMEQYCVNRMNGWIFSGRLVEQNLLKRPSYDQKPRCHAPLGFDTELMYVDKAAGAKTRRELGWESSDLVVGYLGRFVRDKGLDVIMAAMDQWQSPWRLLMVGNGPMLPQVTEWANNYPNRVALCTSVKHPEVGRYVNAMDMMVAPSLTCPHWREQFGRMIVEAFACGVPVIGSDSGEIPFVINDTGLVVPEGDSVALHLAMAHLADSPDLRRKFSEAGIERAQNEFTWSRIAKSTLSFFDDLVDQNNHRND